MRSTDGEMTGTTLTHYRLIARLGAGGMGEVYRATDTKLDREVALKVLPPAIERDPQALARFEREAKALAALNHPHIASIYGFDADQGRHFLVLELVEGETLAERVRRGPLPIDEALRIARQIAEAVEAAHAKGIVHRDLKPGNVKLAPDGRVKVLDFGLAKAIDPGGHTSVSVTDHDAATVAAETTLPGAVLGTPAYMSPEQARGQEVDKRTDVWAFGCCLFECLAGVKPFRGDTTTDLMAEVLKSDPDWSALPADIPREVLTLLRRCLEKEPRRRLSSLGDIAILLEDSTQVRPPVSTTSLTERPAIPPATRPAKRPSLLARYGLGIAGLVLGLAIASLALWRRPAPAELPGQIRSRDDGSTPANTNDAPRTLAVLPFETIGTGPADDGFNEGLTIELITLLQNVAGLQVQGPMASMRFKGSTDPAEAGRQLRVDHLLHGRVRRAGERLRIDVSLQKAADGFGLWATNYERQLSDIFAIQTDVARQVAEALKITLGVEEQRALDRRATTNAEAHALYLQGRAAWNRRTVANFERALAFFNQALEKDPAYALAYAALADVHVVWPLYAPFPRLAGEHPQRVLDYARQALEIDPTLAEPHAALGYARGLYRWDWEGGEREFQAAIRLNPKSANAYHWYADLLLCMGRPLEAIRMAEISIQLDPSPVNHNTYAAALIRAGRVDEGLAHLEKRLEIEPWFSNHLETLFVGYAYKGDTQKLTSLVDLRIAHEDAATWEPIAHLRCLILAWSGQTAEARARLPEVEGSGPTTTLASILYALGDDDRAIEVLERLVKNHPVLDRVELSDMRRLQRLHGHPRYQAILRQLNLQR